MQRIKKFNTKYSPNFKLSIILDMRNNHLAYRETIRKYFGTKSRTEKNSYTLTIKRSERIFLQEREAGLFVERRGRTTKMDNLKKGRPKKFLSNNVKEDLIAENQRLKSENQYLQAEIAYLKKLDALVRAEEQKKSKTDFAFENKLAAVT